MTRCCFSAAVLMIAGLVCGAVWGADHYWQLGVGNYNLVYSDNPVDEARFDWLVLSQTNAGLSPEMIRTRLNRNLAMNPRQKYVIELSPLAFLGTPEYDVGRATFLEYHFRPDARETILRRIRETITWTLETISKPENVYAFSLEEEIPGVFGVHELGWAEDREKVPPKVEQFRADIEKERGKPMVWDDETRLYLGRMFTESLEEIHRTMKEAMGPGHKVLFWLHGGFKFLDELGTPWLAADTQLGVNGLYPCKWSDICKPGVVEALVGWPDHELKWARTVWVAEKFGLPFFTQVNHNANLRLVTWPECVKAAKTRHPLNLGYFYFCSPPCSLGAWNDDPAFRANTPENEDHVAHVRRHCAQEQVGTAVVSAYLRPRVELQATLSTVRPGGIVPVSVLVHNPATPDLFRDPREAMAEGMEVTLRLPKGCRLEHQYNFPATVKVGSVGPDEWKSLTWWVTVDKPSAGGKYETTVEVKCANREPVLARFAGDSTVAGFQPHDLWGTSYRWAESSLDGPAVRPWVTMEALKTAVERPSLTDGVTRLTYEGTLSAGRRLVVSPEGKARLYNGWLLEPQALSPADPGDPTGYSPYTEGYVLTSAYLGKGLVGVEKLTVDFEGKVAEGASSLIILQFATDKGFVNGTVSGGLTEQWGAHSGEIAPPEGATSLERLYLLRGGQKGKIWYGKVAVRTSDLPTEGQEVQCVTGRPPTIPGGSFRVLSYADASPRVIHAKTRVQLWKKEPK